MPSLNTTTSAVLAIITGGAKQEKTSADANNAKSGAVNFLSYLNGKNINLSADSNEQSLIENLYRDEEKDVEPVAAPAPTFVPIVAQQNFPTGTDNKRNANVDARDAEPVEAQNNDVRPATKTPDNAGQSSAGNSNRDRSIEPAEGGRKVADASGNRDDQSQSIAEKIRNKINELSDLLALITNALGGGAVTVSVATVSITQVSTNTSQLATSGNQLFTDLSDRFNKLIAAIEASQGLSSGAKQSLTASFASFQSILSPQEGAADGASLVQSRDGFLQLCAECENSLQLASQSLTASAGESGSVGELKNALAELSNWFSDISDTLKNAQIQQTSTSSSTLAAQTSAPLSTNKISNQSVDDSAIKNISAADASLKAAPVAPQTPVAQAQTNNVITPAVAVSAIDTASNFSGNQNSSGQGGDRSQGQIVGINSASSLGASAPTNGTSFAKTLKAASATPVADQVVFHVKTMVKDGSSKIEIKLDPESLGKLTIKVEFDNDGKAGVVVTADNKSTLDLLQRDSRGLERALADAGLKTDSGSLSFNLRGGNSGQQQEQASQFSGYNKLKTEDEEIVPLAALTRSYTVQMSDGLDIKI